MNESRVNVAIAGGGMVGISLALSLAARVPGLSVLVVEAVNLASPPAEGGSFSPSFDARSTALSYASELLYTELGIWAGLSQRAQPIETVHVSEKGRFGSTLLKAEDYHWPALGHVVENAWLGRELLAALRETKVALRAPERIVEATAGDAHVDLRLEGGDRVQADLLVVADGARSRLRESLGISHRERPYNQSALIANIGHRQAHQGRAYERFTESGPLALLPLVALEGHLNRSALVWTLPPERADFLQQQPDEVFLAELQREFGYRLGKLVHVGERQGYPLSLLEAGEQVRNGVIVMGNAAHSLHPVAGQGFNLALRDVACLAALLAEAWEAGESPGSLAVLERYREAQAGDQFRTTAFSDRLPELFMHRDIALGALRDLGLFTLDISPGLKQEFARHTAGLAASVGYRNARP